MDELLLLWPESMGTQPWLTMWRRSSLDLEVSWPSAAVIVSCIVSKGVTRNVMGRRSNGALAIIFIRKLHPLTSFFIYKIVIELIFCSFYIPIVG